MSVVDDYLKTVDGPEQAVLEHIRKLIHETAPGSEEVLTYGMPGFKYKKKYLASFAVFKDHMSLFPGSEAIADLQPRLKNYKLSKGTIQFTLENPLTDDLVRDIITHRVTSIDGKGR